MKVQVLDDGSDVRKQQSGVVNEKLDDSLPVPFVTKGLAEPGSDHGIDEGGVASECKYLAPTQRRFHRVVIGGVHEVFGHRFGQPHWHIGATNATAESHVPKPLLPTTSLVRPTEEPYTIHEARDGVRAEQVPGEAAELPQHTGTGWLPGFHVSKPRRLPMGQGQQATHDTGGLRPAQPPSHWHQVQQAGAARHHCQQTQEVVVCVGVCLRLTERLVDNEIETLLDAVLAQGLAAYHGNSPSQKQC